MPVAIACAMARASRMPIVDGITVAHACGLVDVLMVRRGVAWRAAKIEPAHALRYGITHFRGE